MVVVSQNWTIRELNSFSSKGCLETRRYPRPWRVEAVRKNIRPFHGRPIIAWPISAAHDTGVFDHVIVSTAYPEIAEVAAHEGAEIPFLSPDALSND